MARVEVIGLDPPPRGRALPAMACAAGLAVLWLVLAPRTADFAAQVYRTHLFAREGFALWDNNWFGGHHMPGYSLLFPALAALLGPAAVGIAAVLASTSLFAALLRDHAPGSRWAIAWFACAASGDLFIGRLTFALGVTCALACLVAAARARPRIAVGLGVLTACASPVSALLLAVVLVAWLPPARRRWRLAMLAAPPGAAVALSLTFPEGGTQPFAAPGALVALGITLAVGAAIPSSLPAVRRGALLYAAVIVMTYVIPSPMGSNVTRLGVLAAGPVLVLSLRGRTPRHGRRRQAFAATALVLGVAAWQLWAPVTEVLKARDSHATSAAYFAPLNRKLATLPAGRLEVVPTSTRWESVYVADRFALARGWETQLDRRYNGLFYGPRLTMAGYLRWLRRLGVGYVALDDGPKERWGRAEQGLLQHPGPGLRLVWRTHHWHLFAVSRVPALVTGGRLVSLRPQSVTVATARPGPILLRVRYTRLWRGGKGVCVSRTPQGFTRLRVPAAGTYTVRPSWQLRALLDAPQTGCPAER